MRILRPPSLHEFTAARHMSKRGQNAVLDWEEGQVSGPDVTRRETLLLLAKMTGNSYYVPGYCKWYNLTGEWRLLACSWWEPDGDECHGYVYATKDNSSVVFTIKATTCTKHYDDVPEYVIGHSLGGSLAPWDYVRSFCRNFRTSLRAHGSTALVSFISSTPLPPWPAEEEKGLEVPAMKKQGGLLPVRISDKTQEFLLGRPSCDMTVRPITTSRFFER
ncbi:hypothetical protein BGW80DRAFT_1255148 [Lactifluus volemus]|nr:hypothetical protein BGW80DRAFT_1255148 [Lactifluus volemus]